MLSDLMWVCGCEEYLAADLAVSVVSVRAWLWGNVNPGPIARKVIWLIWVLYCDPGCIENMFDLATWGRFRCATVKPGDIAAQCAKAATCSGPPLVASDNMPSNVSESPQPPAAQADTPDLPTEYN